MKDENKWIEEMKVFFNGRTIAGNNLNESEAEFGNLIDVFNKENTPISEEEKEIVKKVEKIFVDILTNKERFPSETSKITVKDEEVVIPEDTLVHNCPFNISSLEGISKGGILCSEWFGHFEIADEARFCAFLTEEKTNNHQKSLQNRITLYFDSNHPLMKVLLKNDYFDYIYRKQVIVKALFNQLSENEKESFCDKAFEDTYEELIKNPLRASSIEKAKKDREVNKKAVDERMMKRYLTEYYKYLPKKMKEKVNVLLKEKYGYSDIILKFYDNFVCPNTQESWNYREDPQKDNYYWRALPGGIPARLINGVRICKSPLPALADQITDDKIKKIHELFPNAVIFDKNNKVIPKAKIKR